MGLQRGLPDAIENKSHASFESISGTSDLRCHDLARRESCERGNDTTTEWATAGYPTHAGPAASTRAAPTGDAATSGDATSSDATGSGNATSTRRRPAAATVGAARIPDSASVRTAGR